MSSAQLFCALGGMYEYLRRAYGPWLAFLLGWAKLVLLVPSVVGSLAHLGAESFCAALDLPTARTRTAFAIGIIVVAAGLNLTGVRSSSRHQGLIAAAKYGGVAVLALTGLFVGHHAAAVLAGPPVATPPMGKVTALLGASVFVMWAFDGWSDLLALTGELRNPARTLSRALVASVLMVTALYVGLNLSLMHALGYDGLSRSGAGANLAVSVLAAQAWGTSGMRWLNCLVSLSCIGGCMSSLLTGSRLAVPMATDGQLPVWLGSVSPGGGVPRAAVAVCASMATVYAYEWSFEQLIEGLIAGYFPFYVLVVGSVFVLRRREPDLSRPFCVPCYPVVPAVFLCGATMAIVATAVSGDRAALPALSIVLVGLSARWAWVRWRRSQG